ncbi:MAG: hypothetical protein ACK4F9_03245 [Brevinematia bacterium]
MKKSIFKILFLLFSYIFSLLIIYMALTNTGIFEKRLKSKIKILSHEMSKNIEKALSKSKSITEAIMNDPNIKLIFFQMEIGGNKREYIGYLSRLRSSVNNMYKIVLLKHDGSFFVSSEYFENDFKEFSIAKKFIKPGKITFFGSFDVLYSISEFYDQRGILKGYLIIGWYKDLFKQYNIDSKNIKFIQDLILINFPDKINKINIESSIFVKKALVSEKINNYNLTLLLYKSIQGIDSLNIIVILLLVIFSLMITLWFLIDLLSSRKIKEIEEIKDEILYNIENENQYFVNYNQNINSEIDQKEKMYLQEEKHKYEEIESEIVPISGILAERSVATVREIFEFVKDRMKINKVMLMNRTEDGFIQTISEGFETSDFAIYFTDKVWDKFISKGKAVSIKGDIKELYELGGRLKDDLFEITIFPILDMFGNVMHLILTGRRWTENDPGLEVKKDVFSKIKYLKVE